VKLKPGQLDAHLASGLKPVYLVSGDEPLLVDETVERLRRAARDAGCDERQTHLVERGFDWNTLRAGMDNLSLFASRQLVELRLPTGKPGDAGGRALAEIAEQPPDDKVFVVITPKLPAATAKSRWVTKLAGAGAWIAVYAPRPDELPRWLAGRLRQSGLKCEPDALALLASRIEGNLLAAKQEIDKLVLLADDGRVDLATVRAAVGDGARYDVFQLADAALAGDSRRAVHVLQHLEQEAVAPTLVLWSLVREISAVAEVAAGIAGGGSPARAAAAAGVWRSREQLVLTAVRRLRAGGAEALLDAAALADRQVKGARPGGAWPALLALTLSLSIGELTMGAAA
jgi:DNA polymerase-3 subunit delta